MKTYAQELKTRREAAGLTTRRLGDRIDKSSTFVTDFELAKKSNPPEPEVMARLAEVLNWPVSDQLQAWGYAIAGPPQAVINPFPPDDIRHRVVEAFKRVDLSGPERAFWLGHFALELRMLRDIEQGLLDDVEGLGFSDHEQRSEGTVERNNIA